jgi:hypothetical protein
MSSRSISPASALAVVQGVAVSGAATSAVNGAIIDTAGYEGVLFVVRLGTPNAGNTIRLQQSAASNFASPDELAGATVASGAKNIVWIQVRRPAKRYVRVVVTRAVSTTVDWGVAMLFGARNLPQDNTGTGIVGVKLVSPAVAE